MKEGLQLQCTLSSSIVPVSSGPRLVYLLLEVTGSGRNKTLPSNLGFVIDTSDSMRIRLVSNEQFTQLARSGQAQEIVTDGVPAYQITSVSNEVISRFPRRIDYVSEALVVASEYLREFDRFSLVAFAGRAHCMIPSTPGRDRHRLHQAARELEYLRLGDETQMAEGISAAFAEVLKETGRAYAGRLILLTDGHTRNVSECYEWARRTRKAGLKMTTMGIGVEFNEDLLIRLADMTGGNAYYIETPDQIPNVFRQELGAALRISYRNVEVKLQLSQGVTLRRVYRVLPEISLFDQGPDMNGSYAFLLGDFDPAAPQGLLAELVIPPWPEGTYRLAQSLLAWDDPAGGQARPNQRMEVFLNLATTATTRLDGRVMNIVEKVGAFKMGTQALEAAQSAGKSPDSEERKAATVRLRQAATRLLDLGEKDIGNAMLQQAEALEHIGSMDPEATKRLRYETRRMTQHT